MREDFYRAFVPDQTRVLGFALRPLSLGHLILLRRVGSAFLTGAQVDFRDLAVSVFICTQTYRDGINALNDPDLPRFMRAWHDRIAGSDKWLVRLGLHKPKRIDFEAECKTFVEYLNEHMEPPHYTAPSDGEPIDCAREQIVRVCLMRDLHLGEEEILDRSWRVCIWDYITLRTVDGHLKMIDREKITDAMEKGRKLAELLASGKVKVPNGAA